MQYAEYVWSAYLITALMLVYQGFQAHRQYQQARLRSEQDKIRA